MTTFLGTIVSFVFIRNCVKFITKLSLKKAKQPLNYLVLRPFCDVKLYCVHWKLGVYFRPQLRPEAGFMLLLKAFF